MKHTMTSRGCCWYVVTVCVLIVGYAHPVFAYVPEFVTQPTLHDMTIVTNPHLSQVFFGELVGMPHTYEVVVREPLTLSLELRTPKTASSTNSISGIIIKVPRKGRVEEITRLLGREASWEERTDTLTGDTYRIGSSFTKELSPGVYRIEIHTPDNAEKYMLHIGTVEEMTIGYFELIGRLLRVKDFYGTPRILIVCSPYVYWPLIGVVVMMYVLWRGRRFYMQRIVRADT